MREFTIVGVGSPSATFHLRPGWQQLGLKFAGEVPATLRGESALPFGVLLSLLCREGLPVLNSSEGLD